MVRHIERTPSSSGAVQSLPELALCVFIVVTFLVVMVDRAELVENGHGLANQ
jgi:hypothetical protein